jgi:AraC family transcriptional regulator of adaptative response / DNA-3-methyladenine glycosylase II
VRSAAQAEVAGFRPCLRCRPELAPGSAAADANARLAQAAVALIDDGVPDEGGVESLAQRLGVTSRHLRRVFATSFGVSPVEYAQTHRLLLAKRLLTDTALPVTDIAFASGFRSVRRFNALFRTRYGLAPAMLRRHATAASEPGPLRFELAYRPPYDWPAMLEFLARRVVPGMELVADNRYVRTLRVRHDGHDHVGIIAVAPVRGRDALRVELAPSLARVVPAVLARVRHAFDTNCDPQAVAAVLGELAASAPGLRVPGTVDGFELATRVILGQQISVASARTLLRRLVDALGERIPAEHGLDRVFPSPERIAATDVAALRALGIVPSRTRALVAIAHAIVDGKLALEPRSDVPATVERLCAIPGIGAWSAEMIAMRALAWPDAFPAGDGPLRAALGETSAARATARSAQWQPWRSYAVMHLWRNR